LKENIIPTANKILVRYKTDYFNIGQHQKKLLGIEHIEFLREQIEEIDLIERLERLFQFDDSVENAIWEVKIKITDERNIYNAAEIGYLLWSFSKAIESLPDIEVELISWGEGSKLASLIIRIKNLALKWI
jgi:hypothetical protein